MRSYFSKLFIAVLILSLAAIMVSAGLAFQGGAGFGSGSVIINTDLRGVSGGRTASVTATITDGYNLTAVCRNKGGNIAYGQNPVNINNISVSQSVAPDSNGNASANFHIYIIQQAGITWDVAGCPNRNWVVTDLLGGINVHLVATDGTFTDTLDYSCFVNELDRIIACTQV